MTAKRPAKRQPWRKWYTGAWRADAPLRMCSYAARGLWADLLTLMHESPTCGFLLVNDVAPTAKQLTGLLGGAEREVRDLLAELGAARVYSVTGGMMPDDVKALVPSDMPAGVLLSRRMVRDEAKAARDRANGRGGGNPQITPTDNPGVNPPENPQMTDDRKEAPKGLPSEELPTLPVAARAGGHEGPHAHDTARLIGRTAASVMVAA